MKKLLLIMLALSSLFAKIDKISPIPPAEVFYINLEPAPCDNKCLAELVKKGFYVSFLARYDEAAANASQRELYATLMNEGDAYFAGTPLPTETQAPAFMPIATDSRIAVLVPQKVIKSYALTVTNSILAYVARTRANVGIRFYLTGDESAANLERAITSLSGEGYAYVIAPVTSRGLAVIADTKYSNLFFYIPTLSASATSVKAPNIVFGGVDYAEQIALLMKYGNGRIAAFSDGSALGDMLSREVDRISGGAYLREMSGDKFNAKAMLEGNGRLRGASIFLNTPLLKTALLSSQFRFFDLTPHALLSTQINYDPAIFSLTQYGDRRNLYVAHSFTRIDDSLCASAGILGANIAIDRVGYPSAFGVDYVLNHFVAGSESAIFGEKIEDGQVKYDTKVLKAGQYNFTEVE